jgi:hypothetical protein
MWLNFYAFSLINNTTLPQNMHYTQDDMIRCHGLCPIHRKSFRPKALQPTLFEF